MQLSEFSTDALRAELCRREIEEEERRAADVAQRRVKIQCPECNGAGMCNQYNWSEGNYYGKCLRCLGVGTLNATLAKE